MPDWFVQNVLLTMAIGGMVVLALWPSPRSGLRLLRTWGIEQPRPDQVAEAVRYLWQRRILYIVGFLALPPLVGLVIRPDLPSLGLFVPLLFALLVAESVATVRPVGAIRVARLDRRGWRDLVPRWAVRTLAAMALLTVALAGYGLTQERDTGAVGPTSWAALVYLVVCLAMIGLLVHLAVRRPSVPDEEVDAALRRRTARVAVGIGFGWVGTALNIASQRLYALQVVGPGRPDPNLFGQIMQYAGVVTLVVTIGCWLRVALPSRRSLARV